MLLKRGFGPNRRKDFFVVEKDGDTWSTIVAGPFPDRAQAEAKREELKPLYFAILAVVSGHLTAA